MPTIQSAYTFAQWEDAFQHPMDSGNPHGTTISDIQGLNTIITDLDKSSVWLRDQPTGTIFMKLQTDNLNIGTGNLVVDNTNNYIGLNSSNPTNPIELGYESTKTSVVFGSNGTSFSSSYYNTNIPDNAFNENETNGWLTDMVLNSLPQYLGWQFDIAKVILSYSLLEPIYKPTGWTFEGWDGTSWVVLDTRNGQDISTEKFYTFSNNIAYSKYRINIFSGGSAGYIGIKELRMYEDVAFSKVFIVDSNGAVNIKGSSTGNEYCFTVKNGNLTELFSIKNNGYVNLNSIVVDSNSDVYIKNLKYPNADGSTNQVLYTNGSGVLSFNNVSALYDAAWKDDNANGGIKYTNRTDISTDYLIAGYNLSGIKKFHIDNDGNLFGRKYDGQIGIFSSFLQTYNLKGYGSTSALTLGDGTTATITINGRSNNPNYGGIDIVAAAMAADYNPSPIIIKGGTPFATATVNKNGGNVIIDGGIPISGGLKGEVYIQGLKYPKTDGTASQAIMTDGLGNLSFGSPTSSEWARDSLNGYLYPRTNTDNILIPGSNKLYFRATNSPWIQSDALGNALLFGEVSTEWGRFEIVSGGTANFGIGTSSPSARIHSRGVDSTSSYYGLKVDNSANSNIFTVRNDGLCTLGGDGISVHSLKVQGSLSYLDVYTSGVYRYSIGATNQFQYNDGSLLFLKNYTLYGGTAPVDTPATTISMVAGNARAVAVNNITGASLTLAGGNGALSSAGLASGGDVLINGGTGYGTGTKGNVIIQGLKYPKVDGTASQAIITDGSGNLSFGAPSSSEWARDAGNGIIYPRTATDKIRIDSDGRAILIGSSGLTPNRYIQFRSEDTTSARFGIVGDNSGMIFIDGGTSKSFAIKLNNGATFGTNATSPDFYISAATKNITIGDGIVDAARLYVKSSGNTSSTSGFIVKNSSDTILLNVIDNGNISIGSASANAKLDVNGGIRMANDASSATSSNVGTLRYYSDSNNSFVDMCMQTGSSTYAWVNIHTNTW